MALTLNGVNKHIYVCKLSSAATLSVNNSYNGFRDARNFSRNLRFIFFYCFGNRQAFKI